MSIEGWYYLHVNGELIYKRELGGTAADIRESDFARGLWPCDPQNRQNAWTTLVEALAAGANKVRVMQLASHWHCDDEDAQEYAKRIGCRLYKDGSAWCATRMDFENLQASPSGFGVTGLEAMAELCKKLGYIPAKMWGMGFEGLLNREVPDVTSNQV